MCINFIHHLAVRFYVSQPKSSGVCVVGVCMCVNEAGWMKEPGLHALTLSGPTSVSPTPSHEPLQDTHCIMLSPSCIAHFPPLWLLLTHKH